MGIRIEVFRNGYSPAVYVKAVGVMQVRQVVEEVAHSTTHIKHHSEEVGERTSTMLRHSS